MKIGDSFFVPDKLAGPAANIIRPAVAHWKKRNPEFNYTTRVEKGGYRVWRIAISP